MNNVKKNATPIFENLRLLKKDMEENGWIIEAFRFNYKKANYIVLVILYQEGEKKPRYALLKMEIIKEENLNRSIIFPANSTGFIADTKKLREFFNINYSQNIGEILQQFSKHFSSFIPTEINQNKSEILKTTMIMSLSKSDSEDPNKTYCYTIRRNPNNAKRTLFNDNKTKLLRPNLYLKFKEDPTISFCYSLNRSDEKADEEILSKFSTRV